MTIPITTRRSTDIGCKRIMGHDHSREPHTLDCSCGHAHHHDHDYHASAGDTLTGSRHGRSSPKFRTQRRSQSRATARDRAILSRLWRAGLAEDLNPCIRNCARLGLPLSCRAKCGGRSCAGLQQARQRDTNWADAEVRIDPTGQSVSNAYGIGSRSKCHEMGAFRS